MARRSPLNPRYQKNTQPAGKTRRSASAAKPKREAGGQSTAPKKKAAKPTLREAWRSQPTSPEMRKWRRIWWVAIGLALVVATVVAFVPAVKENRTLVAVFSVLYLVFLGGAFYIDLGIIRKLRAQARDETKAAEKKK